MHPDKSRIISLRHDLNQCRPGRIKVSIRTGAFSTFPFDPQLNRKQSDAGHASTRGGCQIKLRAEKPTRKSDLNLKQGEYQKPSFAEKVVEESARCLFNKRQPLTQPGL